ncbi:uncharacterized protein BDW70DRAFT_161438 [Aspergillus foveolatus]|uniref:uncharacterized protein n=1 Tax=Aspergillus foveolatus TaxID=210207 RepID=UPI003CCCA52D
MDHPNPLFLCEDHLLPGHIPDSVGGCIPLRSLVLHPNLHPLDIRKDVYGYNDLIVGLCYLPGGFGVILGGLVAGRLMDWNYKHTDLQHGLAPSTTTNTSAAASTSANTNADWAIEHHAHPSIPLILQDLIGAKCTIILQTFSALLVNIFPGRPGTAAAANNITRCALSAAAIAALQPLSEAVGRVWLCTMLALGWGSGLGCWFLGVEEVGRCLEGQKREGGLRGRFVFLGFACTPVSKELV